MCKVRHRDFGGQAAGATETRSLECGWSQGESCIIGLQARRGIYVLRVFQSRGYWVLRWAVGTLDNTSTTMQ